MTNGRGGVLNAQASEVLEVDHGLKVSRACWYTELFHAGQHQHIKAYGA